NPAGAPNQVLGVFAAELTDVLANVLKKLGSEHVLVVNAEDGLDEISIGAPTRVSELKDGSVSTYTIEPEQFGMERQEISALAVDDAEASLAMIRSALGNEGGPARDIVALNAGAAIYAAGLSESLGAGVEKAAAVIASGAALEKLDSLKSFTNA
ncbi:MAG: anthranilate phosphoribosyltransferase, partial [Gammaproteobacteria bacterium]